VQLAPLAVATLQQIEAHLVPNILAHLSAVAVGQQLDLVEPEIPVEKLMLSPKGVL
jgi:hypothetical protein